MPPLVYSHIGLEWQFAALREWYERLAAHTTVIRYDVRGFGLSQRKVADLSAEAYASDIDAVFGGLGLDQAALCASFNHAAFAVRYAATRPECVSRLILWCPAVRFSDSVNTPQLRAGVALRDQDWELYTESVAHIMLGWSSGRRAHDFAAFIRASTSSEHMVAFMKRNDTGEYDAADLLPLVRAPTLVFHRGAPPSATVEMAKEVAAGIAGARLILPSGRSFTPFEESDSVVDAIVEFVAESTYRPAPATAAGLVTILFTDLVSSTALTQRLGDAKAQELVRAHNAIVRDALTAHGGTEIKHTGDGIMASFPTTSGALQCAVAIQRGVAAAGKDADLQVHIGLNAGEPVAEESDLFGTSVQLARRICDHAEAGQILVSDVVRQLAAGKGFLFSDIGEVVPKGFEEPVRLYEVRWRE